MKLALLGATGSIGTQTLDVLRRHRDTIELTAVTCGHDAAALAAVAAEFGPRFAGVLKCEGPLPAGINAHGADVNERAILETDCDTVLDSVVGMAGLGPVLTALGAGKRVLLANKEALVAGGELVMRAARELDAAKGFAPNGHMPPRSLLPVDSEHSAIFQCIASHPEQVRSIILTASGGPFRTWAANEIYNATPRQALSHPTWQMGAKVTLDSASLFNKGLEVIEACRLFDMPPERVRVLVHPQSIVHSMVEFIDGSVLAQLAVPDMRGPIAYALGWPERIESGLPPLELAGRSLTFEQPDMDRFPCLGLAYRAMREGGGMPCVLNAADEAAVEAFLQERIPFGRIPELIADALERFAGSPAQSGEQLIALGQEALRWTRERCKEA